MRISLGAALIATPLCMAQAPATPLDTQNYIIGTQVFGSNYHFTHQSLLVEGANELQAMGSNMIKFAIGPSYRKSNYVLQDDPNIITLTDLAKQRDFKKVFDMPFNSYILWTYALTTNGKLTPWHGHMKLDVLAKEYQEIYDLTRYLLTTYNGSGKTFYLGNWEGDWGLNSGAVEAVPNWNTDPNPDAAQGMIDWLIARQRAIDAAKRDTPHKDVQVWFYVEANLVQKSVKQGRPSVAASVLPFVNPDFVSYSSYDSTNSDKDLNHDLPAALNYMQSKLKPKPGLPDKRVFIGEFGAQARLYNPKEQEARVRAVSAVAIKWGTPFVLYWQLYNNEMRGTQQAGFWLIDDKGVKQPVYYTYQRYYADAKAYVAEFRSKNKRSPSDQEFRNFVYKWLVAPPKTSSIAK